MANVTTPTVSTLPVAGADIIAAPLNGWITNIKSFVEGANIDENNVDYSSADGIVVKQQTQTLTGAKTFSAAITASAGVISGGNILSDTDSTDDLGSTSKRWANVYTDALGDTGQALGVKATTLSFDAASTIDTSGNNNLTLDAGTATLTLDAATIESDATTLSFDSAATIDTSGNNQLTINTGSANLAITTARAVVSGDLEVAGDDLFMGTNTSGHLLIADGTNYNPTALSGDITVNSSGVTAIGSGVIVNADVKSDAAIAQSKLDLAITASQIAAATLVTESEGISSNDNDTTLPTSAAVKDYVDTQILTEDTLTELNDTNISSASSGQLLIYDGSDSWDNQSLSGDVTVNASGVTAISSDVIVNADIKSDAAIADSKLATISTSNKVSGSAVQLASTTAIENSSGLQIKSAIAGTGLSLSSQVLSVDAAQTQITSVGTLSSLTTGGNIVSDTDSTDDLGTTSVRWANLYVDSIGDTGQALAITAGSNNVNVTAGTLALTGAQTISSTLGVSGNVTISKDAPYLIMTDSGTGGGTSKIAVDAVGSNYGLYFQADGSTNHVILESNGDFKVDADTLFVDASADSVGINNASPTEVLDVAGAVKASAAANNWGYSASFFDRSGNDTRISAGATSGNSSNIAFWTYNSGSQSEKVRITSEGDLLIGTTSDQIARVFATTGTSGDYAGYFKNTVSNRGVLFLENTNTSLADAMHRMTASAAYNGSSAAYSFLVATGNAASSADTEFVLRGDGEAFADGAWNASGADYQEYFESTSGESAEVGRAIVLDGDKVRYYNADTDSTDDIMGVTRPQADNKNSAFVGNVAWNHWTDKYLTDDWGVYLREDVTVWTYTDEKGDEHAVYERAEIAKDADWTPPSGATSSTQSVRKLNPDYDESLVEGYQSREERDEWWLIGLLGQIQVKAGEPVNPRWIKMKNISDAVELYYVR